MRIVLTGATGFLGRALVHHLLGEQHAVTALVRSSKRAAPLLGPEVRLVELDAGGAWAGHVDGADAVVHLAGAPVLAKRWSRRYRREMIASRAGLADKLVAAAAAAGRRPRVLVSASAAGYYGDRGDEELGEESGRGQGFLAELCEAWELAARQAEQSGTRVVSVRIGAVLGLGGGALGHLLPMARRGLAGRLGPGDQFVPWIHIDDAVQVLHRAIADESLRGAINATAPRPVTNRELTDTLARLLGRSARLALPAPLLRLGLGQRSSLLLASQRVVPRRLLGAGFSFRFADLESALADLIGLQSSVRIELGGAKPETEYTAWRPPRYVLRASQLVGAPIDEVFAFFSRAENLGAITPAHLSFAFAAPPPRQLSAGSVIEHRIRLGPVPMRWRTVIEAWEPGRRFVDAQHVGPYRSWWHEHRFSPAGSSQTVVEDTVHYAPPLGALGRLVNALAIRPMLREIFAFRAQMIRHRLGPGEPQASGRGVAP